MNYFQPPERPGTILSTSSCIFPQSWVVCADQPNTLGQQKLEGPPHISVASLHATPFSPYYTANSGHPGSLHVSQKASFRYSHTAACKLLPGRQLVQPEAHNVCLSSLKDHDSKLPAFQSPKPFLHILSGFIVISGRRVILVSVISSCLEAEIPFGPLQITQI